MERPKIGYKIWHRWTFIPFYSFPLRHIWKSWKSYIKNVSVKSSNKVMCALKVNIRLLRRLFFFFLQILKMFQKWHRWNKIAQTKWNNTTIKPNLFYQPFKGYELFLKHHRNRRTLLKVFSVWKVSQKQTSLEFDTNPPNCQVTIVQLPYVSTTMYETTKHFTHHKL